MAPYSRMETGDVFFSQRNEAVLQRVLYNDLCRRTGKDLSEKQANRLISTVKHYMSEVYRVATPGQGVKVMNAEVLRVVLPDYMSYLDRNQRTSVESVSSVIMETEVANDSGLFIENQQQGQMDIDTAFSQLQTSRNPVTQKKVVPKDFRIPEIEMPSSSSNLEVFERMKYDREQETIRQQDERQMRLQAKESTQRQDSNKNNGEFVDASDSFNRDKKRVESENEAILVERERKRLEVRASSVFQPQAPPDIRSLFLGDRTNIDRNNGMDSLSLQPAQTQGQKLLQPEKSTIYYKETELNLFVYSGDRDWSSQAAGLAVTESRYNFTVMFDSGDQSTLRLSPTANVKFKNIVRIEFVKAIVPGEGLDILVSKDASGNYDTGLNINVLSFPYIQVRIQELDTNIYGTNQGLNASFGVLQYDANWMTDSANAGQRGYFAMIPKFIKCQKIYSPTPLATLQKLSFRFERPDGTLLSSVSDTLDISSITPSSQIATGIYGKDTVLEQCGSAYYWLKTATYFNHWTVVKGHRIQIRNVKYSGEPTILQGGAVLPEFLSYLQQDAGLLVVDTGIIEGPNFSSPSSNPQGYANAILVRGKFSDPSTGAFTTKLGNNASVTGDFDSWLSSVSCSSGRLLNQSHQVQVAMRVITREIDSAGVLRPDNL